MTPWLTTIVPRSIAGPDTGTMRAFVIANDPESARGAPAVAAARNRRAPKTRSLNTNHSWKGGKQAAPGKVRACYRPGYDRVKASMTPVRRLKRWKQAVEIAPDDPGRGRIQEKWRCASFSMAGSLSLIGLA